MGTELKMVQEDSSATTGFKIPEAILKRNAERQEKIAKLREQNEQAKSNSQLSYFEESFKIKQDEISNLINSLESMTDRQQISETLKAVTDLIQLLNKYLSSSSVFLRPFKIRICRQVIEDFEAAVTALEVKLLPKKKFGFKSKPSVVDKVDGDIKNGSTRGRKPRSVSTSDCCYSDLSDKQLRLSREEVNARDVCLFNLKNCQIWIEGCPNTLLLDGIENCLIACGPVTTSVMVSGCVQSQLALFCQQLRVHTTRSTKFFIRIIAKTIIEDTTDIQIAPYNYSYSGFDEDLITSKLDPERDYWDQVDDFNWLVHNQHSPNWSILLAHLRPDGSHWACPL